MFLLIIILRFIINIAILKIILLLKVIILLNLILKTLTLKYILGIYRRRILRINLILKNFINSLNKICSFRNSIAIFSLNYLFICFVDFFLFWKSLNDRLYILLLLLLKINAVLNLLQWNILAGNLLACYVGSCSQSWSSLYLSNVILNL